MELKLRFEGQDVIAQAEWIQGVLWLHHGGKTWSINPREMQAKKRRRAGAANAGLQIDAPMPGKITKILKQKQESVHRGDAVVVMEAMKMEYTLKAETEGTVSEISCQVGDQVALGQTLVVFQAAEKKA